MKQLFQYNWQVREEWFNWCKQFTTEQLLENRAGGFGNILHTLLHIIVVEYDWINDLNGGKGYKFNIEEFNSSEDVIKLHNDWHAEVERFVTEWKVEMSSKILELDDGRSFTYGEVVNHVIVHEVHHIGQLSIWARELGSAPISANLIGRGLQF
jgi:uncharacterized damage-inducible protein DinB